MTTAPAAAPETTAPPAGDAPAGDAPAGDAPAAELRAAGEAALAAERTARKEATRRALAAETALETLRTAGLPEAERAAAAAEAKGRTEATAVFKNLLARSALSLAAAGKLTNPDDAAAFIDLSAISVGDDGVVDAKGLDAMVAQLLKDRPYLAATAPPAVPKPLAGGGAQSGGETEDGNAMLRRLAGRG